MEPTMQSIADGVSAVLNDVRALGERVNSVEQGHEDLVRRIEERAAPPTSPALSGDRARMALGAWFAGTVMQRSKMLDRYRELVGVEHAALQEDTDSEGGYLVPAPLRPELLRVASEAGIIRGNARVIPMSSKTLSIPNLAGSVSTAVVAEEGSISDSVSATPFNTVALTAKKIASLATLSLEVDEDAILDLGSTLLELFVEAMVALEDTGGLETSGSDFVGIRTASGVNEVDVSSTITDLSPFAAAKRKLQEVSVRAWENAIWVMSPLLAEIVSNLKEEPYSGGLLGAYRLDPFNASSAGFTLWGRPVRLSNAIADNRGTGTNETTAYLGWFQRGFILGDRTMPSLLRDPFTLLADGQIRLRVHERVALHVAIPSLFSRIIAIETS